MEIGQRLLCARQEAGLSQRQLCEGIITRNMLSQIENGAAKPSMGTLQQLSVKLGKPMSYFLEEQSASENQQRMETARAAYEAARYTQVLDCLEAYKAPDAVFDWERWYLDALTRMALSRQMLAQGKTAYALTLLEQAKESGKNTPYYTQATERQRLLLCYRIKPAAAVQWMGQMPREPEAVLLQAEAFLPDAPEKAKAALDLLPQESGQWHYLQGQACRQLELYAEAIVHYKEAEAFAGEKVWPSLEECYRELGDFQQAYKYACLQKK